MISLFFFEECVLETVKNTRYQGSANLFKLCRKLLDNKYQGVRIIDQDVGQIIGLDPADCSHWKRGKKSIRTISAIKNLSEHIGLDYKLIVSLLSEEIDHIEAFFEYSGYGSFVTEPSLMEEAKKLYYRKYSGSWSENRSRDFQDYFFINRQKIKTIVQQVHKTIQFEEAPLYLPEIVTGYRDIVLSPEKPEKMLQDDFHRKVYSKRKEGKFYLYYPEGQDMRPYMRFQLAKKLAEYFLPARSVVLDKGEKYKEHLHEVESNLFAAELLVPSEQLRKESENIDPGKDLVSQLAEVFWVSKSFMNKRLQDFFVSSL